MAVLTHCCPPRWISIDVFRLVFTSFFKCCLLRCDNTTHILSRPPKSYDIPFMRDFCCEILLFFFSGFCFVMMEDISRYTQECFCVYCERVGSPLLLLCVKHSSTKLSSQKKDCVVQIPNATSSGNHSACNFKISISFLLEIIIIKPYRGINWVKKLNLHPFIDFLRSFYANAPYINIIAENENCMNIFLSNFSTVWEIWSHVFRL